MPSQYKVERVDEGFLGVLFTGASVVSERKLEDTLNANASRGYKLVFATTERKRAYIFWEMESVLLFFIKE